MNRNVLCCLSEIKQVLLKSTSWSSTAMIQLCLKIISTCTHNFQLSQIKVIQPYISCFELIPVCLQLISSIDNNTAHQTLHQLIHCEWPTNAFVSLLTTFIENLPVLDPSHARSLQVQLFSSIHLMIPYTIGQGHGRA